MEYVTYSLASITYVLIFVLLRAASRVIAQWHWCEAACWCRMDGKMSNNDESEQPLDHV